MLDLGFPRNSARKESACSAGDKADLGLIPGLRRPPGGEIGNALHIPAWSVPRTEEQAGSPKRCRELDSTEHTPDGLLDLAQKIEMKEKEKSVEKGGGG